MRRTTSNLHPKIQKNLLDLEHERYLQKSHTIINLNAGSNLAFLGGLATYIIEGHHQITINLINFTLFGICSISTFFICFYYYSRKKRFEISNKVKSLNAFATKL